MLDALTSGVEFVSLYLTKSFISGDAFDEISKSLKATGIDPVVLSDSLINAACDTKTPQGVVAIIKTAEYKLEDILRPRHSQGAYDPFTQEPICRRRFVILDGVSDPGNAGVIIRTAEAAGFSGLIMSDGCVDLYSPKTLRASMGSAFRLPVVQNADLHSSIRMLKSFGVKIYATAAYAEKRYYELDLSSDFALVVGNEAFGIRQDVLELCDESMSIPMPGGAESLNVGVAAGIIIYESLRQLGSV